MRLAYYFFICLLIPLISVGQQSSDTLLYVKQDEGLSILSAKLQPIKDEKQYITADMIKAFGVGRLSDLIAFIDKQSGFNLNSESFVLNQGGRSPFLQNNVLIFINYVKVELPRFHPLALNQLGIAISDIAWVEVIQTPTTINGTFVPNGAIHIITRNDAKGFQAKYLHQSGNPVNDPGPARYIPGYASPNIDRVGSVHEGVIGYYFKKGHIKFTGTGQDIYTPDTLTLSRHQQTGYTNRFNRYEGFRIEAAMQHKKTSIDIGYAKQWFTGVQFHLAYQGFEQVKFDNNEGRLQLVHAINKNRYFKFTQSINFHHYQTPNTLYNDVKLSAYHHHTGNLAYGFRNKKQNKKFETGLNLRAINSLAQEHIIVKPYVWTLHQKNKKTSYSYFGGINVFNQQVFPEATIQKFRIRNVISSSKWILAYQSTSAYMEQGIIAYNIFINKNANSTFRNNGGYVNEKDKSAIHRFSGDYFYIVNMGGNFKVTFNGGFRLGFQELVVVPEQGINNLLLPNSTLQAANTYSFVWGTNIHYDVIRNFWIDIDYFRQKHYSNTNRIEELAEQMPINKLLITANIKLPERFEISLRSSAQSAARWTYYLPSSGLRSEKLPAVFTADLAINKKLWKEKLNINLNLRNLWFAQEQYHPIGADLLPRVFITAGFQL
ncbi:MAG: hypothetical protein MUC81_06810 [Bacteroidia bacterium]|jgi:hypothetical protein|nr:hypothetical protein [Bacteroidia bacterium]